MIQKSNEPVISVEPETEKPQTQSVNLLTTEIDSANTTENSLSSLVKSEEKVDQGSVLKLTDKIPVQTEKIADTNRDLSKETIIANNESEQSATNISHASETNTSPTKSKKKKEKVVLDPLSPNFHNFLASSAKKQELQIDIEHPASIASPAAAASNQNSSKSSSSEAKNVFAMDTMVSYKNFPSNNDLSPSYE